MIIDHIGLNISDAAKSRAFYSACLAPLGIRSVMEFEDWSGFGRDNKPEFWFGPGEEANKPMHIAFSADSRAKVDEFYKAAIAAGGKDNGAPGIREEYHPNYYGAFVFDPDGHNIEAVCHKPE
jgi:catechol 2,3-dioxygenase-like lactoylglutathione lyase family enzyme